jgi:ribosomal protein S18 acetylase RimI-like enzyme
MVPVRPEFFEQGGEARLLTYFVAEDESGAVIGTVTGIDHGIAFDDPERGSSLWALAVDPQTAHGGVGEALIRWLAEHYIARGAGYMDLSVLHDNRGAIALYAPSRSPAAIRTKCWSKASTKARTSAWS